MRTTNSAHIVGLRYYLQESVLNSLLASKDSSTMPLSGKTVYLMADLECEQDDHAVMAYDEWGAPLGHVSKMEADHYACILAGDITSSIQGHIVGMDPTRHSLIVETEEMPDTLPLRPTEGSEWKLTLMNTKLPHHLAQANHALMIAERMAMTHAEWSTDCEQAFSRLMELTTCDLAGDTYRKRVTLARLCKQKSDKRWQQAGDRLMALIDHMGGDELMHHWVHHTLPLLIADDKVQRLTRTYKDYTPAQLTDALLTCPREIGREWLSGNHMLFAKRLYYAQLPQQLVAQILVLVAMTQGGEGAFRSSEVQESFSRSSEVQEFRSSDNSFSKECRRQECRSIDNSFDYEKQKESASSAQSAPKKSCGLCHPEDTEGPVNVSRRGGVCPPEHTTQTHSLGQADPAPTEGENKESASSASSASKKLVSDELQATSDEMQAALSSTLLSEASLLHSYTPERLSYTPERLSCTPKESPLIRQHADVALAHMRDMQPLCTQKVDWLSFYTVLLRRRWVEENLSAFCRMVGDRFGVFLDNRTLSRDLKKNGPDYTLWIDDNNRISRRKRLAQEFDQHLAEYFKRGREEVMKGVR